MVIFMEGVDMGRKRQTWEVGLARHCVRDGSEVKDSLVPAGRLTECSLWKGSKFSCLSSPCFQAVCSRS